jgi:hypothetical protein
MVSFSNGNLLFLLSSIPLPSRNKINPLLKRPY